MLAGKTPEALVALLEQMEQDAPRDRAFLEDIVTAVDRALVASDTDAFLSLEQRLDGKETLTIMSRSPSLLQLRYLITAVKNERAIGYPLFTDGVYGFHALLARHDIVNHMLRRIEFDIGPEQDEPYRVLLQNHISPYAVSAVLYGMTSRLGHREQILLKISEAALSRTLLKEALGFLSVIEQPSADTLALRAELEQAITGGAS